MLEKHWRAVLYYIKKKDGLRTLYSTHHIPHCLTDYNRACKIVVEVTETIREWGKNHTC
jgi:DNA mismatch repair ATPase MutS